MSQEIYARLITPPTNKFDDALFEWATENPETRQITFHLALSEQKRHYPLNPDYLSWWSPPPQEIIKNLRGTKSTLTRLNVVMLVLSTSTGEYILEATAISWLFKFPTAEINPKWSATQTAKITFKTITGAVAPQMLDAGKAVYNPTEGRTIYVCRCENLETFLHFQGKKDILNRRTAKNYRLFTAETVLSMYDAGRLDSNTMQMMRAFPHLVSTKPPPITH